MSAVKWVTIRRAAEISGYSEDAIRSKIADGTWLEGKVWRRAPDNRILISTEEGYDEWAEGRQSAPQLKRRSAPAAPT
jgi:hypothetical protein